MSDLSNRHPGSELLDLAVVGPTVITGDQANPLISDCFIGVKDGILQVVKKRGPMSDPSASRTLRLESHVVIPGLVNLHTHVILSMVRGVAEDLGFAPAYVPGLPHATDVDPDSAYHLAKLGSLEAASFGSTTIVDSYVHAEATARAIAEIGIRGVVSEFIVDADLGGVGSGRWEHDPSIGRASLSRAVHLVDTWDGQDRIRVAVGPHAPDTCSDWLLAESAELARSRKLPLVIHLAQSKTEVGRIKERGYRTPVQQLEELGVLGRDLIAAHCIYITDDDIGLIADSGTTVAHIPKGNATAGRIAPTSILRKRGARMGLGTDNMHGDMIEVMRWAIAIGRIQEGEVTGSWQPADTLEMASSSGARALGFSGGTLKVGSPADFVALDFARPHLTPHQIPLGTLVHTAQGGDVTHVVVGGDLVVEAGHPTRVDPEEVIARANEAVRKVWARS